MRWDTYRTTLKHWFRKVRGVKTWQLLVVLLLAGIVTATLLRMNNLGMVERRTAVLRADEKGDRAVLQKAIVNLQKYVSSHMNASMGDGIYLSKTYEHDRDAAIKAASNASNPNSAVYQQASVECRARWQGGRESFRNDYVQCVVERVSALSPATDPASSMALPKAGAYKINYASPLWSPDLAGFSLLLCMAIVLIIVGRLVMLVALRLVLKRHYRSI